MSSSYYLKNLIKDQAYLVKHQEDQYILLDGRCHPDFYERPLSSAGGRLCVRKPGTRPFGGNDYISKPRTGSTPARGEGKFIPRQKLWSAPPDWETRTDYPNLGYSPDDQPPKAYSQVSVWQGASRRVPDQPELVDGGYLRQRVAMDGLGFGSNHRNDKYDYLYNFNLGADQSENEPRVPRVYNVCDLTQKYPLWKEATKASDMMDLQNTRRIV
jgi:hypothetical protein